jgi:hypothetical protein
MIYFLSNGVKINNIYKRYLQSFPNSILKYSKNINKKNKNQLTIKLTIQQFIMAKEVFTEKERNFCMYCKGCGIIICLECEISNDKKYCYRCNGHKYITCYICNGSGITHSIF